MQDLSLRVGSGVAKNGTLRIVWPGGIQFVSPLCGPLEGSIVELGGVRILLTNECVVTEEG